MYYKRSMMMNLKKVYIPVVMEQNIYPVKLTSRIRVKSKFSANHSRVV